MRGLLASFAAAWMVLPMTAHGAEIVTFTPLATAGYQAFGKSYSEKGLTFKMIGPFGFFGWGTGNPANADPGGATLMPSSYGDLVISSTQGTAFDLLHFDIADLMNRGDTGPILYDYESLSGSGHGQIDLNATAGLQAVSLNLSDLKRFTISVGAPFIQLDNVAFALTASPVPEPRSWALLIGGVAMAGGALRRRRAGRPAHA
ncbi:hypothetical protein S2M10_25080 [Sphingomonas sp. S2M10]|jgi:hypothetical protein|uniref:PEPxxWA-CTERM sorting domain-containing protein n=1 Tax=Sphingomonas sp. S2M10 TaxID=2705010 RepID=UPI0016B21A6A|nr:PEPxxWA-CTERM sorting domain-containing protein [Sphingomonas sp. S2M10]NLS27512.1 hypothetical protein [Sphingomonas sp. S2M10]